VGLDRLDTQGVECVTVHVVHDVSVASQSSLKSNLKQTISAGRRPQYDFGIPSTCSPM
jgi:hypothetical protein